MKRFLFSLLPSFVILTMLVPIWNNQLLTSNHIYNSLKEPASIPQNNFGNLPLLFIPNHGQMDEAVAYYVQGRDKTLYFAEEGITISLLIQDQAEPLLNTSTEQDFYLAKDMKENSFPSQRWAIKLEFVGAQKGIQPEGHEQVETIVSYFKGSPEQWKVGLNTYAQLVYPDLWPGIDLKYAGKQNSLKYEFRVSPGADPSQIRMSYQGINGLQVNEDKQLVVTTSIGEFRDDSPLAYQEIGEKRVNIPITYNIHGPGSDGDYQFDFSIGAYDTNLPLIIDPEILLYSTFLGGNDYDYSHGIAVDQSGAAYITGLTRSPDFPTTPGAYQVTNSDEGDVFVAKLSADGSGLVYSTFLGGSDLEVAYDIAVDEAGAAYLTGYTNSLDYPTTPGAFQTDCILLDGRCLQDIFITKLDANGSGLVYSTRLGGSYDLEKGYTIAIDPSGSAYVSGYTYGGSDFPTTPGAFQSYCNGCAFVTKLNASGSGLVYSTFLGGSAGEHGYGIAVDESGAAYITGHTASIDFPTTPGAFQTACNIGWGWPCSDVFVSKLNSDGSDLVYSTYLGGEDTDEAYGIAVDDSGAAFIRVIPRIFITPSRQEHSKIGGIARVMGYLMPPLLLS
jgi:hypothetical protein